MADGDVLTEIPWSENPLAHSNAGALPPPPTSAPNAKWQTSDAPFQPP